MCLRVCTGRQKYMFEHIHMTHHVCVLMRYIIDIEIHHQITSSMYKLFNINKKRSFICNVQNNRETVLDSSRLDRLVMKHYCCCVQGVYIFTCYLRKYFHTISR